jgi:hypothetical protein
MPNVRELRDPYRRCEERCRHDLGRGLTIAELFGETELTPIEFATPILQIEAFARSDIRVAISAAAQA